MSKNNSNAEQNAEAELPSNVKKLTPEHALILENLNLKISLISQQMSSAQKDLETLKSQIGGFVNGIKGNYFQEQGNIAVDPVQGLIILQVPEQKADSSETKAAE